MTGKSIGGLMGLWNPLTLWNGGKGIKSDCTVKICIAPSTESAYPFEPLVGVQVK